MAIKICNDVVCIGDYYFCEVSDGIYFSGQACAKCLRDTRQVIGTDTGYFMSHGRVESFPFATDTDATCVAPAVYCISGASHNSPTAGYSSGGSPGETDGIIKFNFSTQAAATCVGALTQARYGGAGASSNDYGYNAMGFAPPNSNRLDRFPFVSDGNASCVSTLAQSLRQVTGMSGPECGYHFGGTPGPFSCIFSYPFASETLSTPGSTCFGNGYGRYGAAGQFSASCLYASGGGPSASNCIQKWSIASGGGQTGQGSLTQGRYYGPGGVSSENHGYTGGGLAPGDSNVIDKFPFASTTNATDVGDLSQARAGISGFGD